MALLDLLGRRWSLRVVWEVHTRPGQTFRELQAACGDISSSVLGTRLGELTEAGVIERGSTGYRLTRHGEELLAQLLGLENWANRWSRRQSFPRDDDAAP